MDYATAGEKRVLEIHELEELRLDAYENAKIYKERIKKLARQMYLKERV